MHYGLSSASRCDLGTRPRVPGLHRERQRADWPGRELSRSLDDLCNLFQDKVALSTRTQDALASLSQRQPVLFLD